MMLFRLLDANKEKVFYDVQLNGKEVAYRSTKAFVLNKHNLYFPGLIKMILENEEGKMIIETYHDEVGEYSLPKKRWYFGLIRWKPR